MLATMNGAGEALVGGKVVRQTGIVLYNHPKQWADWLRDEGVIELFDASAAWNQLREDTKALSSMLLTVAEEKTIPRDLSAAINRMNTTLSGFPENVEDRPGMENFAGGQNFVNTLHAASTSFLFANSSPMFSNTPDGEGSTLTVADELEWIWNQIRLNYRIPDRQKAEVMFIIYAISIADFEVRDSFERISFMAQMRALNELTEEEKAILDLADSESTFRHKVNPFNWDETKRRRNERSGATEAARRQQRLFWSVTTYLDGRAMWATHSPLSMFASIRFENQSAGSDLSSMIMDNGIFWRTEGDSVIPFINENWAIPLAQLALNWDMIRIVWMCVFDGTGRHWQELPSAVDARAGEPFQVWNEWGPGTPRYDWGHAPMARVNARDITTPPFSIITRDTTRAGRVHRYDPAKHRARYMWDPIISQTPVISPYIWASVEGQDSIAAAYQLSSPAIQYVEWLTGIRLILTPTMMQRPLGGRVSQAEREALNVAFARFSDMLLGWASTRSCPDARWGHTHMDHTRLAPWEINPNLNPSEEAKARWTGNRVTHAIGYFNGTIAETGFTLFQMDSHHKRVGTQHTRLVYSWPIMMNSAHLAEAFQMVYHLDIGREEDRQLLDNEGNPMTDEEGNPVYALDLFHFRIKVYTLWVGADELAQDTLTRDWVQHRPVGEGIDLGQPMFVAQQGRDGHGVEPIRVHAFWRDTADKSPFMWNFNPGGAGVHPWTSRSHVNIWHAIWGSQEIGNVAQGDTEVRNFSPSWWSGLSPERRARNIRYGMNYDLIPQTMFAQVPRTTPPTSPNVPTVTTPGTGVRVTPPTLDETFPNAGMIQFE
jgi:hypothetical protein